MPQNNYRNTSSFQTELPNNQLIWLHHTLPKLNREVIFHVIIVPVIFPELFVGLIFLFFAPVCTQKKKSYTGLFSQGDRQSIKRRQVLH